MKKILCLILSLIMIFSLVACNDEPVVPDDQPTDEPVNDNPVTPTKKTTTVFAYDDFDIEGKHIYVSNNGHDKNDGKTKETAVKTIKRANELAKAYVAAIKEGKQNLIIAIEAGEYYQSEELKFVSGSDNVYVYYTSYGGDFAKITGGVNITEDKITLCTDESVLNKISNETIKNNLYEVNLSEYRDVLTSLEALVHKAGVNGELFSNYDLLQFYYGESLLQAARWPNYDELCEDTNLFKSPTEGYCLTNYINYTKNGAFKTPAEVETEGGKAELPMNIFLTSSTYEKLKTWDVENEEIYTADFFGNNWDDTSHKVIGFTKYKDINGSKITMPNGLSYDGYFTVDWGRNYNGEMTVADGEGGSDFRRFYFYNVLEEIDLPGEFYYSQKDMKLYVYLGENADVSNLYIATTQDQVTSLTDAKNVNFINLKFEYSQSTLLYMKNVKNVLVRGCYMGYCAGYGMYIDTVEKFTFKNSRITYTGIGGVYLCNAKSPTTNEQIGDAEILFENSEIDHYTNVRISYCMALSLSAVSGVVMKNCTVHDGGHGAITWGKTCNLRFEHNEFYNCERDTDDVGLFYTYGNFEYQFGIVFDGNVIHDIGSDWQQWHTSIWYQDWNDGSYTICNNIIYNINRNSETAPAQIFGKMKAGLVYNNIVFNAGEESVVTNGSAAYSTTGWCRNIISSDVQYDTALWSQLENVGFGTSKFALFENSTDADFTYSYNMIKYIKNELFYEIFGNGLAVIGTESVQMTDKTIRDFQIVGKSKTYVYNTDFKTVDEFFEVLRSLGYKSYVGIIPSGVTIKYKNSKVKTVYMNLLKYDTATKAWVPGSCAMALSNASPASRLINADGSVNYKIVFSDKNSCYGSVMALAYFTSAYDADFGYFGEYHTNITVNIGKDFSCDKSVFGQYGVKITNSVDFDDIEWSLLGEDGNYSVDFLDWFDNLTSNGVIDGFNLLDLSSVGAKGLYKTIEID